MKKSKLYLLIGTSLITAIALSGLYLKGTDSFKSSISSHSLTSSSGQVSASENNELVQKLVSDQGNKIVIFNYTDFKLNQVSDVYSTSIQNKIANILETIKNHRKYTLNDPLLVSDPFLTNTTGLYVHFTTENPSKISYVVKASDYANYNADAYSNKETYVTNHDFQLLGAVAGVKNTITITATNKDGSKETKTFTYTPPKLYSSVANTYKTSNGTSSAKLSNGLYTVIGLQAKNRATYYVDNNGVIRGEVPIVSYNSMRLATTQDGQMYLGISQSKLAKMNRFGQITQVIDLASQGYEVHHDFELDSKGDIWALATSKKRYEENKYTEDQIVKIDHKTGKIVKAIDAQKLLPELYKIATGKVVHLSDTKIGNRDLMHFNSIQLVDDDTFLLSSRETSTIMKITNINSSAKISYMIANQSVWQGVGDYSNLLFKKVGNFIDSAGQHSLVYEKADNLGDGQYYLSMFDNNYGLMDSRPSFDWSAYKAENTYGITLSTKKSMYYKYLVDENKHTYTLVSAFAVPYSSFVSDVQHLGDNVLVASGQANTFTEYDKSANPIRTYTLDGETHLTYRTLKYDFKNFYFE